MNRSRSIRGLVILMASLFVTNILSVAFANHNPTHQPIHNDNSSGAYAIPAAPFANIQTTVGATMEAGEVQPSSITSPGQPRCPTSTIGATVWYKYKPAIRQSLSASTLGSDFDTLLAIWVDWAGDGVLTLVGCQDNFGSRQSRIQFAGSAGINYWFQVGGKNGVSGSLAFELLPNPVGNDNLSDAVPLPFAPVAIEGSNAGASIEAGEYLPCGNIGATIWYRIDLGADGFLTFETSGSSFNTVLALYQWDTGSPYPSFLACNDDVSASEKWSSLSWSVRRGSQYYIQVGGAGADYGAVKLTMSSNFTPMPPTSAPIQSVASPKMAFNDDGSITVYVDSNSNGQPDAGEAGVTAPRLPDGELAVYPRMQSNPDGSTTVYNDTNRNGSPDPGETIVTTPRTPRITVRVNSNNTVTIYDDKNNNGTMDTGEEIYTTPAPPAGSPVNPKVTTNPDGSTTVYNDTNSNNQVDPGETIVTVPAVVVPPPANDNQSSAAQISSRAYLDFQFPRRATVEATEPIGCGTLQATVWYRWSRAGSVLLDTQGSTYSVTFAVYSVGANGALTLVGCSTTGTHNATFGFVAQPGQNYLVQVGNLGVLTGERLLKFSATGL